jgi:hypothetical protein
MRSKFTQRKDYEGFSHKSGEIFRLVCCDCGLTHDMVTVINGDEVGISAVRNNRATAQLRRHRKFTVTK